MDKAFIAYINTDMVQTAVTIVLEKDCIADLQAMSRDGFGL